MENIFLSYCLTLTLTKYGKKRNIGSTNVTKSILSIGMTSLPLKNDL